MTSPPNVYNKYHCCDVIFSCMGQVQITERSIASKYDISKSLCLCGIIILGA